jgi:hypothetical protein
MIPSRFREDTAMSDADDRVRRYCSLNQMPHSDAASVPVSLNGSQVKLLNLTGRDRLRSYFYACLTRKEVANLR